MPTPDACCFCDASACPVVLRRPRFLVRRCPGCRVMWCDPPRFDDRFRPDDEQAYLEVEPTVASENRDRLSLLSAWARPGTHERLVEVGCMHGDFVEQAAEVGYRAQGLDLSDTAVAEAERRRPGLVRRGTLDEATPDASLDVVAAFNVIEHMDAPQRFLDHVRRVLRPGGVLVLETPAQESLYHHVLVLRGHLLPRRPRLEIGMHPGTHIYKFGHEAWRRILKARGFSVLEVRAKSTPLRELLAKNERAGLTTRAGIVGLGLAARATGLGNRVQVVAQWS
jgi:2-polyprenyl-3-methyl-5-hydroxy-6-metoxy-1,4-benzoquinol methylase